MRTSTLYLKDISESIKKILDYTKEIDYLEYDRFAAEFTEGNRPNSLAE